MKEPLLISGCLLGLACRYDGGTKPLDRALLDRLMARYQLIPCCPEQLGGLPSPRDPSERRGYRVFMRSGQEVTQQYMRGAEQTACLAELFGCKTALLKQRSPSCGSGSIYDGSFTGKLIPGDGITAELLKARGITVYGESQADQLLES